LDYASPGVGSSPHIIMEVFCSMAGIELNHIPFKTSGLNEVIAGHVALSFEATTIAVPYIKAGRVSALAVAGAKRKHAHFPFVLKETSCRKSSS